MADEPTRTQTAAAPSAAKETPEQRERRESRERRGVTTPESSWYVATAEELKPREPRTLDQVIKDGVREPGDPPFPAFGEKGHVSQLAEIDPRAITTYTAGDLLFVYASRLSPWGMPKPGLLMATVIPT